MALAEDPVSVAEKKTEETGVKESLEGGGDDELNWPRFRIARDG